MTSCACTRGESDPGRESEFGTTPGLGPVLGFSLCLYFRYPSISDEKIAVLVETTGDRAAATVKSVSTVFIVQQQQRAVSTAEEFCFQIHAIKLAIKPQQK